MSDCGFFVLGKDCCTVDVFDCWSCCCSYWIAAITVTWLALKRWDIVSNLTLNLRSWLSTLAIIIVVIWFVILLSLETWAAEKPGIEECLIAISVRDSPPASPLNSISSSASCYLPLGFLGILIERSSERIDLINSDWETWVWARWANNAEAGSDLGLRLGRRIERRVV